jgi:putative ABC transport system permease protein
MNVKECIKGSIRQLMGNKLRSFLTMLGMFIGIASVIMILSVGAGLEGAIAKQVRDIGSGAMYIEVKDTQPQYLVTQEDLEVIRSMPEVEKAVARTYTYGSGITNYKQETKTLYVSGIAHDYGEASPITIEQGRMFTKQEEDAKANVAVVSDTFSKVMYGNLESPLGKIIELELGGQKEIFEIIGVYDTGENVEITPEESLRGRIYLSFAKMDQLVGTGDLRAHSIYLMIDEAYDSQQVGYQIGRLLDKRHNTKNGYNVQTILQQAEQINSILGMVTTFIGFVAAISLLVGGIGIMNIMLVTVKERTREIGIRKAIGATNQEVLRQFLIEAVILTLIGGIIGLILGYLGGNLIIMIMNTLDLGMVLEAHLKASMVIFSVGVSSLIGIVFGVYPAKQAAKLDPIEALRYE